MSYFNGSFVLGIFMTTHALTVILAINRCLAVAFTKAEEIMFHGYTLYVWISIGICYGLYYLLFTETTFFTSWAFTFFYDPYFHYEYKDLPAYTNMSQYYHNIFIGVVLFSIYSIFAVCFLYRIQIKKRMTFSSSDGDHTGAVFTTVFTNSLIITTCSIVYLISQYFPVGEAYLVFSLFMGLATQGANGVIYLCLNPSIRNTVLNFKIFKFIKADSETTTTIIVSSKFSSK
uniref:7TM_GPCR_Srx domain-containing protein n=1 Tax=Rhabditophanes sp. KR3021 TaxID=114890 RepID=A0AC35TLY6_9BILA